MDSLDFGLARELLEVLARFAEADARLVIFPARV
jgi:hypothetical protein